MEMNQVIQGDCLEVNDNIQSGKVDLILCDLPYGNMLNAPSTWDKSKTTWDIPIEPKKIYNIATRILRKNGKMVLFAQDPYTTRLISESIANLPFSYRAIWKKDNFANALGVNKNMVSFFEDILIFTKPEDTERTHTLIDYFYSEQIKSGLSQSDYNKLLGNKMGGHYFTKGTQFRFPTERDYLVLQTTGFFQIPYSELKEINDSQFKSTFNLWEGKKFKSNILEYRKDYEGLHPTQKPLALIEDLVRTFSNENDLVVDLTAGSGTVGVACEKANRNYILIEKEQKYVDIARERIQQFKNSQNDFLFNL